MHQKNVIFVTIQLYVCNGCHDVLMMSVNLNDIAILNIKGTNYYCIIHGISKSGAAKLLQNADLTKKRGVLQKKRNYKNFFTIYKVGKEIITLGDIEVDKQKFQQHKSPILINNVDISK